jgi:hypothetical protein
MGLAEDFLAPNTQQNLRSLDNKITGPAGLPVRIYGQLYIQRPHSRETYIMNTSMQTYLNLVEACPMPAPVSDYDCHQAVVDLLGHALTRKSLATEGVWRLHREEVWRLEQATGYRPPSGWKKLCALAAGCGVLTARSEDFVPAARLETIEDWGPARTRIELLEAFSQRLVPPAAAAALFLLLGIHPLWGLRLAHRVHRSGGPCSSADDIEAQLVDRVDEMVFGALSGIIATLRQLEPHRRYGVDALSSLVGQCCARARREAMTDAFIGGQTVFIDDGEPRMWVSEKRDAQIRAQDFTTEGLIGSVFVPAAAMTRFDDGTFCVSDHGFAGVRVGRLEEYEQNRWLTTMISGEQGNWVA